MKMPLRVHSELQSETRTEMTSFAVMTRFMKRLNEDVAYLEGTSFFVDLKTMFSFDRGVLFLQNPSRPLRVQSSVGFAKSDLSDLSSLRLGKQSNHAVETGRPWLASQSDASFQPDLMVVPIFEYGRCMGVMALEREREAFQQEELECGIWIAETLGMSMKQGRMNRRLSAVRQRYQNLIENAHVPVFFMDSDGNVLEANQAFLDLFAFPSHREAYAANFYDLTETADSLKPAIDRCREEQIEIRMRAVDGRIFTAGLRGALVKSANGRVSGFAGFVRDLSQEQNLEEQLIQSQKMQAIGALTGEIIHDFNNLLGGIMGYASLILSDMPSENPYHNDVSMILDASRKAAGLTAQLLAFSRRKNHETRPVSVNGIVTEILNVVSSTFDRSILIQSRLLPNLAPVNADPNRIQQALMNLCINARDAMMRGGRLCIETENIILGDDRDSRYRETDPGVYILIRVSDEGDGIPAEIRSRIFEPFFTTKEGDRGSGLGLSIVKRIVESYNGGISVTSEIGKGSVFEVVLPACDGEVERCDAPIESDIPNGAETILLVDDEELIRLMAKRMLEKFGYRVETASNGEEAVAKVESGSAVFDLVILDLVMPKMDGRKTFETLRGIDPKAKILLASGTDPGRIEQGWVSGMSGFIQKPFMAGQLLRAIRSALDGDESIGLETAQRLTG